MLIREKDRQTLQEIFSSFPLSFQILAFGSRVKGGAHEGSDIDLVVRMHNSERMPAEAFHVLLDRIANSNIPVLIEVLDWAAIPQSFRENILMNHEVLFDSNTVSSVAEPKSSYEPKKK